MGGDVMVAAHAHGYASQDRCRIADGGGGKKEVVEGVLSVDVM